MQHATFIPINYDEIYQDRHILITGVGRSGTSILGNLIASMQPSLYLFEPAMLKYCDLNSQQMKGVLFEDYFLNVIHGRMYMNPNDLSYLGNYLTDDEIKRRQALKGRDEGLEYIENHKPYFIIKSTEQFSNPLNANVIGIIRNGFDVISSSIKKGWYTDDFCKNKMINTAFYNYVPLMPFDDESIECWPKWSNITRMACIWRIFVQSTFNKRIFRECIKYEFLIKYLGQIIFTLNNKFGLEPTNKTNEVIENIKSHPATDHKISLTDIQEPELQKFKHTMEAFGYI